MIKGKRGMSSQQYFYVAEAVFALFVFIILLGYIQNAASNSLFEQNFMARDAAMLTDAVYSAPGEISLDYDTAIKENTNFLLKYSLPKLNFGISFGNSKVEISSDDTFRTSPVYYLFGEDSRTNFEPTGQLKGNITIAKANNELKITEVTKKNE